jgi:hypothetical protein
VTVNLRPLKDYAGPERFSRTGSRGIGIAIEVGIDEPTEVSDSDCDSDRDSVPAATWRRD